MKSGRTGHTQDFPPHRPLLDNFLPIAERGYFKPKYDPYLKINKSFFEGLGRAS